MATNTFTVYLMSNDPSYPDNKQNKFKVHLPVPLNFEGNWLCGLSSIQFPHSWPTIGGFEEQYVLLVLKDGRSLKIPISAGAFTEPQDLLEFINKSLKQNANILADGTALAPKRRRRHVEYDENVVAGKKLADKIVMLQQDLQTKDAQFNQLSDNDIDSQEAMLSLRSMIVEELSQLIRRRQRNTDLNESQKSWYTRLAEKIEKEQQLYGIKVRLNRLNVEQQPLKDSANAIKNNISKLKEEIKTFTSKKDDGEKTEAYGLSSDEEDDEEEDEDKREKKKELRELKNSYTKNLELVNQRLQVLSIEALEQLDAHKRVTDQIVQLQETSLIPPLTIKEQEAENIHNAKQALSAQYAVSSSVTPVPIIPQSVPQMVPSEPKGTESAVPNGDAVPNDLAIPQGAVNAPQ